MPRVIDIIHRLFPVGTLPGEGRQWRHPPIWPPDLFAAASTLVGMSGCYTHTRYTVHWSTECFFNRQYIEEVQGAGRAWGQGHFPHEVTTLWNNLLDAGSQEVSQADATWCDAAMKLIGIADEAAVGIGFVSPVDSNSAERSRFADYLFEQHRKHVFKKGKKWRKLNPRLDLPNLPLSLCWMVPPSEVCVQPKARTPQVGCTLRSLSHNLALLPPIGEIATRWLFWVPSERSTDQALNLLLVPFPFQVDSSCFSGDPTGYGDGKANFFSLRQNWLKSGNFDLSPRDLSKFLIQLVMRAKREVREVDGLVLPEAALRDSHVREIAKDLARQTDLEVFISGVFQPGGRTKLPQNKVYTGIFYNHQLLIDWEQAKHHRWRLDRDQICRYSLGDALNPKDQWWEQIELPPRTCAFYVFRYGASLAALVCEDLARIDPVQVALRSVGPNLVVVLLMDGPQLERRWPGRYATVLADDPGSAVLTLTCLGMVRRSSVPGEEESRHIALWKEPYGVARELKLPRGCHALLLTLSQSSETNYSLDGRSDRGGTVRLLLSGVRGISYPGPPRLTDEL